MLSKWNSLSEVTESYETVTMSITRNLKSAVVQYSIMIWKEEVQSESDIDNCYCKDICGASGLLPVISEYLQRTKLFDYVFSRHVSMCLHRIVLEYLLE